MVSDTFDDSACKLLQSEEWEVLESIYPEYISSDFHNGTIKLEIPVDLGEPKTVEIDNAELATSGVSPPNPHQAASINIGPGVKDTLTLTSLPPLLLHVMLPSSYPLRAPPQIVSFRATHSWIPNLHGIQRVLYKMWQAGDGVLFNWVEFIRSGEFLSADERYNVIRIHHPSPALLSPLLVAYEASTKSTKFTQNSYACAVCLSTLKGSKCLQLSCLHIFCRSCLEDFWKLLIAEGDVGRVTCPDPDCVKAGREANEDEIMRVVTEQEVQRWKWLREKRALEKDPTLTHCPMSSCQMPVPAPEKSGIEESGWDRLRTCGNCSYSFCSFCKRTWHGPISNCPISVTESLVLEYIKLPEDSPKRAIIERRFGRNNILKLVATYEEEQLNKEWLEASTMACPGCNIHVEKSLGCNHMTCSKCHQHFCYRCGERLSASNPYTHFSTPGQRCYSKLFDFQSADDGWQPMEGFMGA